MRTWSLARLGGRCVEIAFDFSLIWRGLHMKAGALLQEEARAQLAAWHASKDKVPPPPPPPPRLSSSSAPHLLIMSVIHTPSKYGRCSTRSASGYSTTRGACRCVEIAAYIVSRRVLLMTAGTCFCGCRARWCWSHLPNMAGAGRAVRRPRGSGAALLNGRATHRCAGPGACKLR